MSSYSARYAPQTPPKSVRLHFSVRLLKIWAPSGCSPTSEGCPAHHHQVLDTFCKVPPSFVDFVRQSSGSASESGVEPVFATLTTGFVVVTLSDIRQNGITITLRGGNRDRVPSTPLNFSLFCRTAYRAFHLPNPSYCFPHLLVFPLSHRRP